MHIEQGLPDPTTDDSLHLVCTGLRHCQSTPERKRLPITIDILKNLKSQLRLSNYTVGEQRMLWSLSFMDSSVPVNAYPLLGQTSL